MTRLRLNMKRRFRGIVLLNVQVSRLTSVNVNYDVALILACIRPFSGNGLAGRSPT